MSINIESIKIRIKDVVLDLTLEEANKLRDTLDVIIVHQLPEEAKADESKATEQKWTYVPWVYLWWLMDPQVPYMPSYPYRDHAKPYEITWTCS